MSNNPSDLKYTKTHEWLRDEGDSIYAVGITDHAQGLLGDIVFVELPELDVDVEANEEVVVIESVKTAADAYSPLRGHIMAINESLTSAPETINRDPYGDGWIFKIKVEDATQLDALLNAAEYQQSTEEE